MNLLRKIVCTWAIVMTVISCSEEVKIPDTVIHRDTMSSILVDVHLIEAAYNLRVLNEEISLPADVRYDQLLQKYQVTRDQFDHSFHFYMENPKILEGIYDEVINELSRKQAELESVQEEEQLEKTNVKQDQDSSSANNDPEKKPKKAGILKVIREQNDEADNENAPRDKVK